MQISHPAVFKRRRARAARVVVALVALCTGWTSTTVQAAPEDGKKFKNWTIRCETFERKDADPFEQCHMFQDWQHKERKMRILHIAIAYPPQKPDKAVAVLTMPLGIYLPLGVKMQVDKGEMQNFVVERCEPVGCKTGFPLDEALLKSLRRGSIANVTFHDMRRKPITIPVSLNGFTAGLRSLK